jgi:hypothetical protein
LWVLSDATEDQEGKSVTEIHSADALNSAVLSVMDAMRTEDQDAQQDAAHRMRQIAKPWTIRSWSQPKITNGKPLGRKASQIPHIVDHEWIQDAQAKLKTLVGS